jgi:fatty-acyl-CoA synthase
MRITDRSKDCHQIRGRMDFLDRSGKSRGRPSQGGGSRRHRRVSSKMGRAAAADSCIKPEQTKDELLQLMDCKIAKWRMPDDVQFVDAILHTATGKILETALRDQFKNYRFQTLDAKI